MQGSEQLFAAEPLLSYSSGAANFGGDGVHPGGRGSGANRERSGPGGLDGPGGADHMDVDEITMDFSGQDESNVDDGGGLVSGEGGRGSGGGNGGDVPAVVEDDIAESDSDSEVDNFDSSSQLSLRPPLRRRNATESSAEYELTATGGSGGAGGGGSGVAASGGGGSRGDAEHGSGPTGGSGGGAGGGGGGGGGGAPGEASARRVGLNLGLGRRRRLLGHGSDAATAGGGNNDGVAGESGGARTGGRQTGARSRSFNSPTSPTYSEASDSDPPSPSGGEHDSQHNSDDVS